MIKRYLQNVLAYAKYAFLTLILMLGCPMIYIESKSLLIDKLVVGIIVSSIFAITHVIVYTNKFLSKSKWKGAMISGLIIELYGLLLFSQKYLSCAILLICVPAVLGIGVIVYLIKNQVPEKRSFNYIKKILALSESFVLITLMILIALPSLIGYGIEFPSMESDESWEEFVSEYLDEHQVVDNVNNLVCSDETVQKMLIWDELSHEDKRQLLCEVAVTELKRLGIENYAAIHVDEDKLEEHTLGYYSDLDKIIRVNTAYIDQGSFEENVKVVFHEAFHAYQHYVVATTDFDSFEVQNGYYYKKAREWKNNVENYILGVVDFDAYEQQPLERDANIYAVERYEEYRSLLADATFDLTENERE